MVSGVKAHSCMGDHLGGQAEQNQSNGFVLHTHTVWHYAKTFKPRGHFQSVRRWILWIPLIPPIQVVKKLPIYTHTQPTERETRTLPLTLNWCPIEIGDCCYECEFNWGSEYHRKALNPWIASVTYSGVPLLLHKADNVDVGLQPFIVWSFAGHLRPA